MKLQRWIILKKLVSMEVLRVESFSEAKAEREGFEPSIPCGIRAFQARALGLYATSPSK